MKSLARSLKFSIAFEDLRAALRQASLPRALRLPAPPDGRAADSLLAVARELNRLVDLLKEMSDKPPEIVEPRNDRELMRQYADLGTGWWRIWKKCLQPGTERPLEEFKKLYSFVESLRDALVELGIEVIDHTGREIPEGLSLEVLGYQERPGLRKDRVIETVRPTIYFRDTRIQLGRVYAETPPADEIVPGRAAAKK